MYRCLSSLKDDLIENWQDVVVSQKRYKTYFSPVSPVLNVIWIRLLIFSATTSNWYVVEVKKRSKTFLPYRNPTKTLLFLQEFKEEASGKQKTHRLCLSFIRTDFWDSPPTQTRPRLRQKNIPKRPIIAQNGQKSPKFANKKQQKTSKNWKTYQERASNPSRNTRSSSKPCNAPVKLPNAGLDTSAFNLCEKHLLSCQFLSKQQAKHSITH